MSIENLKNADKNERKKEDAQTDVCRRVEEVYSLRYWSNTYEKERTRKAGTLPASKKEY